MSADGQNLSEADGEEAGCIPVMSSEFVGVRAEHQDVNQTVDHSPYAFLGNAPQSGIHGQRLSPSHLVQDGVKLRAVTHVCLHLGNKAKTVINELHA